MIPPTISVVIVSRDRPQSLMRCLTGLGQQYYDPFEVVVVTDSAGETAVKKRGLESGLKLLRQDDANISKSRNAGLRACSGHIVAFIDDDAVPEPTWLHYFAAAFRDASVSVAAGFTRGRNGVAFQSQAHAIDDHGATHSIHCPDDAPMILHRDANGRAIKAEGTNCAFRRSVFEAIGGFDETFHYYLDDGDISMRVAAADLKTAIVPQAQVHHSAARSERRQMGQAPSSLFEVGASLSVYLRKYAGTETYDVAISDAGAEFRRAMIRHMMIGNCEPGDVSAVLRTFQAGVLAGNVREMIPVPEIRLAPPNEFRTFPGARPVDHVSLGGRYFRAARHRARAAAEAASDRVVTLVLFTYAPVRHRVRFRGEGYWEHIEGLFLRRNGKNLFPQITTLRKKVAKENNRVAAQRIRPDHINLSAKNR